MMARAQLSGMRPSKPQQNDKSYTESKAMIHPETAWLVESVKDGHPTWLTIVDDKWDFTADSLRAIRFARKEDAEMLLFPDTVATQHQWIGSTLL